MLASNHTLLSAVVARELFLQVTETFSNFTADAILNLIEQELAVTLDTE